MPKQSEIPGLSEDTRGMFFEHYLFAPMSNFTEEDLYYIAKFFNIVFDENVDPPHTRHFDGKTFVPQEDITVTEFVDILTATEMRASDDVIKKLPKNLQEQFEDNLFVPYDDFGLQDLFDMLQRMMNFRLNTKEFNTLPKKMKRQFIIATRDGKHWRYGERVPSD